MAEKRRPPRWDTAQRLTTALAALCLGMAIASGPLDVGDVVVARSPVGGSLVVACALLYGIAVLRRHGVPEDRRGGP
ncbi:hypothetical protein [Rothia halotolerans]|uniref:hypothetical protein n=1 Tax=Rothia halotolerans TaxID=405770 RepID=UPI00101BB59E|nr:hypothetical protein [Rothia halotolerans]